MTPQQINAATETPRTDAELEKPREGVYSSFFSMASHARQLERELNEAKAEVERLTKVLSAWDYGTRAKREQEAGKKAEAEVERLKANLRQLKESIK